LGHPDEELPADVTDGTHNRLVHFVESVLAWLQDASLDLPRRGCWDVLECNWLKQMIALDVSITLFCLVHKTIDENMALYLFVQRVPNLNAWAVGVLQAS
jgi:hypothetical protein